MSARLRGDANLISVMLDMLNAGRAMATLLEEDIEACGNGPPPCPGCAGCLPARDAIAAWERAAELRREP